MKDRSFPKSLLRFFRGGRLIGVNPATGIRGLNPDASEVVGITLNPPRSLPKVPSAPNPSGLRRKTEQPS